MKDASEGIDFLGRLTRDADGTVWCDQTKYILHCLRENKFFNEEGQVVLRKAHAPPAIDEVRRPRVPWQGKSRVT